MLINTQKLADEAAAAKLANLKQIAITEITGDLFHSDDFSKATVYTGDVVVITGTLDVPDTMFAMPISKNGDIDEMFPASVVDGIFTVSVVFDFAGQYLYADAEANLDLPDPMFKVNSIKIDVMRKIT